MYCFNRGIILNLILYYLKPYNHIIYYYYWFLLNVWYGPLTKSMQTNTVIIVQKTSKGDVSGNTVYTPLGSTYIILTGGKITIRSYLSRLRRDSVGADFQSVRKLTNYVCAKPPESRLRHFHNIYKRSSDIHLCGGCGYWNNLTPIFYIISQSSSIIQ